MRPLIQQALKTHQTIPRRSLRYQFDKLLLDPILAVRNPAALMPRAPMVIVIDALNECDEQGMVEFIETVTKACMRRIRPFPIRILMTSRFEKHLRGIFGSSAAPSIIYPLDSQNFDARDDIHSFFLSRFSMIYEANHENMRDIPQPWPSKLDVETLVEKAGGSFLRASEFIDIIKNAAEPHRELAVVLGHR